MTGIGIIALIAVIDQTGQHKLAQFYHPILALVGTLFCANGVILYRIISARHRRRSIQYMHITLHSVALVFLLGSILTGVFSVLWEVDIRHMSTLHSWLGFTAILSFLTQMGVGLVTMHPGIPQRLKYKVKPYHTFLGLSTLLIFTTASLTGFVNISSLITLPLSIDYAYVNLAGVLLLLFSLLIMYVLFLNPI